MASYLERLDDAAPSERWPIARGWLFTDPLPFFEELRRCRPMLVMPELILVTRFIDCVEVLHRHDIFSVKLYAAKQGSYWMAQDDTPQHWREKSVIRSILDREDIPKIREFVRERAKNRLKQAQGSLDGVSGLTRAVPIDLVQNWFGFTDSDPELLMGWSYWNQQDAFWNQPFDYRTDADEVVKKREQVNLATRDYLVSLVQARAVDLKRGELLNDPVSRLIRIVSSDAVRFDIPAVILNLGGLLIGAVETTSHAAVNALQFYLDHDRRDLLIEVRAAASATDLTAFDGYVFEALRFRPASPYFFRVAERETERGKGTGYATRIPAGTTILAVTHSAMFDETSISQAQLIDPNRSASDGFLFGRGSHECLGRAIGAAMIPEIVRQVLLVEGFEAGAVEYRRGRVPESWQWRWDPAP